MLTSCDIPKAFCHFLNSKGSALPADPKNKTTNKTNVVHSNMSFLKVLGKTEFRFEFSVKNYVFQHGTNFLHFLKSV